MTKAGPYIVVNSDYSLSIQKRKSQSGFSVQACNDIFCRGTVYLAGQVQQDYERLFLKAVRESRRQRRVRQGMLKCSSVPLDPWLIALCMLAWEGIVQGMAWDVFKLYVTSGLNTLKAHQLAPASTSSRNLRFRYVAFANLKNFAGIYANLQIEFTSHVIPFSGPGERPNISGRIAASETQSESRRVSPKKMLKEK